MPRTTSNLTRSRKIALNDLIMVYCNSLKPHNISQACMLALCSDIIERWNRHETLSLLYNELMNIMTNQLALYDIEKGFGFNKGGQYSTVMFVAHMILLKIF